jgi:hypothetical protein
LQKKLDGRKITKFGKKLQKRCRIFTGGKLKIYYFSKFILAEKFVLHRTGI